LVIAGFGIGCLPKHVVAADVDAGLLWRLPPHEGIADVDIHLLQDREQKMSPDGSDVRIARRLARCRVLRLQVTVLIE
jgi:DNA-binding transcriptional LysR family regulator